MTQYEGALRAILQLVTLAIVVHLVELALIVLLIVLYVNGVPE